jgi:hypothetical protein
VCHPLCGKVDRDMVSRLMCVSSERTINNQVLLRFPNPPSRSETSAHLTDEHNIRSDNCARPKDHGRSAQQRGHSALDRQLAREVCAVSGTVMRGVPSCSRPALVATATSNNMHAKQQHKCTQQLYSFSNNCYCKT